MNPDQLGHNIRRLGMCLLFTGSSAAAVQESSKTAQLIEDAQRGIRDLATTTSRVDLAIEIAKQRVDDAVRAIEALENMSECNEQAVVYIGADHPDAPGELLSSVSLHIIGGWGDSYLLFVSGTSASAVVAAINTTQGQTGVQAFISVENPQRIALQSIAAGMDQFVTVEQFYAEIPIVYPQAMGGTGMYEWTDYGCAFGTPVCAEPAEIYLSANANLNLQDYMTLTLEILGNQGQQQFTFYSGTTQANIIAAINTFTDETGVITRQSPENSDRVEFNSTLLGSNGWVRVKQINFPEYPNNLLARTPFRSVIASDLKDLGRDGLAGDVDCDYDVDGSDLSQVIENWGLCPQPPEPCPFDLTGNGIVDVDDLLRVINNWTNSAS